MIFLLIIGAQGSCHFGLKIKVLVALHDTCRQLQLITIDGGRTRTSLIKWYIIDCKLMIIYFTKKTKGAQCRAKLLYYYYRCTRLWRSWYFITTPRFVRWAQCTYQKYVSKSSLSSNNCETDQAKLIVTSNVQTRRRAHIL